MRTMRLVAASAETDWENSTVLVQEEVDGVVTHTHKKSRSRGVLLHMAATFEALRRITLHHKVTNPVERVELLTTPDVIEALAHFQATGEMIPTTESITQALARCLELWALYGEGAIGSINRRDKRAPVKVVLLDGTSLGAEWTTLHAEAARSGIVEAEAMLAAQAIWALPKEDQEWVDAHQATVVYADGSARNNEGFGAWAWWVDASRNNSGTLLHATSFMVEKMAINEAIRSIEGHVLVVSDQTKVKKAGSSMTSRQRPLFTDNENLVNQDRVRLLHVNGHKDCPGNLVADKLAGETSARGWATIQADPARLAQHLRDWKAEEEELRQCRKTNNDTWQARYYPQA